MVQVLSSMPGLLQDCKAMIQVLAGWSLLPHLSLLKAPWEQYQCKLGEPYYLLSFHAGCSLEKRSHGWLLFAAFP